ncbi:hypothetical protein [Bradyrhizobium sp. 62]|uniref:hypothetical protein n=1 Tax=Bradyrhizobium sp. 62 TaxID=1043588 RepID=UPI001FFBC986|nr:hypothetical protein [Bradyrhizobium sp. 62]MCK1367628.1 hypothetical protein [Bradyrhizobium sp. 62]
MASKLYITEYADMAQTVRGGAQIAQQPSIANQTVDYSGGVASSAAFNAATTYVRIHTDSICSIAFGTAPTATTNSKRMPADSTEYFGVPLNGSYKVSAIINT